MVEKYNEVPGTTPPGSKNKKRKIAIVYSSRYGTTKRYARWLSEELQCDIFDIRKLSTLNISHYDCIIFGAALYAGGISKIKTILKLKPKNLIIFTVGLANPETTDYSKIIQNNLPAEIRNSCKIFHLRGGINYRKLSFLDRIMMAMMKRSIARKKIASLAADDQLFLETYGKEIDFSDRKSLKPIIEYVVNSSKLEKPELKKKGGLNIPLS